MRKITEQAINAMMSMTNFKSGNTEVEVYNGAARLTLHGNLIAYKTHFGLIEITNAGWFSNTTKERLNGIVGVSISQKLGIWYLNGKTWDGEWITITHGSQSQEITDNNVSRGHANIGK